MEVPVSEQAPSGCPRDPIYCVFEALGGVWKGSQLATMVAANVNEAEIILLFLSSPNALVWLLLVPVEICEPAT